MLLCNGPHAEAERLREEARQVLWDQLQLELSVEKTHITHVTDGFDFLGFHLQWKLPQAWQALAASDARATKSVERFKRTDQSADASQDLLPIPAGEDQRPEPGDAGLESVL